MDDVKITKRDLKAKQKDNEDSEVFAQENKPQNVEQTKDVKER